MKDMLLTIGLLVASMNSSAQAIDPCTTQRNTIEVDECGNLTLAKKEKELSAAYQKLMKTLVPVETADTTNYTAVKKDLVEAQRNWIKYRDSDCEGKFTLYALGTVRGEVGNRCLIERTEQRTKELLQWSGR